MQLRRGIRYVGAALAGAVFGTLLCEIVISALLEVTVSRVFSIVCTQFLDLAINIQVVWLDPSYIRRSCCMACVEDRRTNENAQGFTHSSCYHCAYWRSFALMEQVFMSGLWCFLLDVEFIRNIPSVIRVFMYVGAL